MWRKDWSAGITQRRRRADTSADTLRELQRRRGGVATQRPAKPSTPVRFRSSPLKSPANRLARTNRRRATRRLARRRSPRFDGSRWNAAVPSRRPPVQLSLRPTSPTSSAPRARKPATTSSSLSSTRSRAIATDDEGQTASSRLQCVLSEERTRSPAPAKQRHDRTELHKSLREESPIIWYGARIRSIASQMLW
jgi:hypothetical protein